MAQQDRRHRHQAPPLWRDIRVLQLLGQFLLALVVVVVTWNLANNVLNALHILGQQPDFRVWSDDNFFHQPARFSIQEGPGMSSTDTFGRAFAVGIVNTLRAVVIGILLATILGILIGVGRLSRNFLVRSLATAYVELFQNTPLLVQLIFIYRGAFLALPQIENVLRFPEKGFQDSLFTIALVVGATILAVGAIGYLGGLWRARQGGEGPNSQIRARVILALAIVISAGFLLRVLPTNVLFLSSRGLVIPAFRATESFPVWLVFVGLAILVGVFLGRIRAGRERRTGLTSHPWTYAVVVFVIVLVLGWIVLDTAPLQTEIPEPQIADLSDGRQVVRRINGGTTISPEYAALLAGLVLYTAAFIGEIVRAGIQAVSYGQLEAAYALGLSKSETLRRIILPQALRVVIPPLGNQYLNLTKNSSLATAIGYADLFTITKTIIHQSGQDVVMISSVMLVYLTASLMISAAMNWLNQRMRLKER